MIGRLFLLWYFHFTFSGLNYYARCRNWICFGWIFESHNRSKFMDKIKIIFSLFDEFKWGKFFFPIIRPFSVRWRYYFWNAPKIIRCSIWIFCCLFLISTKNHSEVISMHREKYLDRENQTHFWLAIRSSP